MVVGAGGGVVGRAVGIGGAGRTGRGGVSEIRGDWEFGSGYA